MPAVASICGRNSSLFSLNRPLAELSGGYGRPNNRFVHRNISAVGLRSNAGAIPSGNSINSL
jgi:hypothetical protein